MKKILIMLAAIIVFAFTSASCGGPVYHLPPAPTPVPKPVMDLSPITDDDDEENSHTSDNTQTSDINNDNLEQLRAAALTAVPDDGTLESAVTRWLISYDKNTIMLALPICPTDAQDDTSHRYHVVEAVVCSYNIKSGNLIESATEFVPLLIKLEPDTLTVENVSMPSITDEAERQEDIKDIFGVEYEGELALWSGDEETDIGVKQEYASRLSKLRYDIALGGGFDDYPNIVTQTLISMMEHGCFNTDTIEGAVCGYCIENSFAYSHMDIPMWHELGREEIPELTDRSLIYALMQTGTITQMYEGSIMTESETCPALIDIINTDGNYSVGSFKKLSADSVGFKKQFGIFADDYLDFCSSDLYEELALKCDSIIESLAEGTFDFEQDSLFPGKIGG